MTVCILHTCIYVKQVKNQVWVKNVMAVFILPLSPPLPPLPCNSSKMESGEDPRTEDKALIHFPRAIRNRIAPATASFNSPVAATMNMKGSLHINSCIDINS